MVATIIFRPMNMAMICILDSNVFIFLIAGKISKQLRGNYPR
jgi:hypothetical protein